MTKGLNGFGVAVYIEGEELPREVTRDELIALRAFDLVVFSLRHRRFLTLGSGKEALAFLKEFRAGRKS